MKPHPYILKSFSLYKSKIPTFKPQRKQIVCYLCSLNDEHFDRDN